MTTAQLILGERRWTVPAELGPPEVDPWRYLFGWTWGSGPVGLFVGLNPSRASATVNDHTVVKWRGFAETWGWGGYMAVNPFALRSTDPSGLLDLSVDVVGPENNQVTAGAISECHQIVACWGQPPSRSLLQRLQFVDGLLRASGKPLFCLGRTAGDHPRHPLRLPYATPLEVYR